MSNIVENYERLAAKGWIVTIQTGRHGGVETIIEKTPELLAKKEEPEEKAALDNELNELASRFAKQGCAVETDYAKGAVRVWPRKGTVHQAEAHLIATGSVGQ
jgi:hypothetical protein